MKKLILGLSLVLFIGTASVSASSVLDNPPAAKPKTEAKAKETKATVDKKGTTTASTEKKSCCSDKGATAGTSSKCSKDKATVASTVK